MTTDFFVLCADTVPENYTWDLGTPLQFSFTTTTVLPTVTSIGDNLVTNISGYAPALNVIFFNNSQSDPDYNLIDYSWNFGDYYHDTNNFVSLTCVSLVQHTYIMPGTYTVTLKHIQSKGSQNFDQTGNSLLCRGKYNVRWFWDELVCINPFTSGANLNAVKWDETTCEWLSALVPDETKWKKKWWTEETACLQKYCKLWSWFDLGTNSSNPVKWIDTETDRDLQKKWMFEANDTICSVSDAQFLDTTATQEQTVIKRFLVTVKEIPPVASIIGVSAVAGVSPLTVRLSPRNCKPGSFPIDRIDWDFGDGSPIRTITRYSLPSDSEVFNTGYFISDVNDVRNIDVIHTYYRNKDSYPVFYPSLTCFSANTNTSDSCCITVGPISFASIPSDTRLLKVRNTLKGNIYTFAENNSISLATTTSIVSTFIPQSTVPPLIIRDGKGEAQPYFGYSNDDNLFPGEYIPGCELQPTLFPERYLIAENPVTYGALSSDNVPIKTEAEFFIYP
jgi:hypothetical protein